MLSFFGGFKSFTKIKRCVIDNTTFRLHYQFTFLLLCIASLLTTARQFFGDPINCIVDGIPQGVMNTYCWIHGTFTLPAQLTGRLGRDMPHPGVGPYPAYQPDEDEDMGLVKVTKEGDEIRHAWYQWVCFVLFLQALLCYVPHYLWKSWEGGIISMLLQGLDGLIVESDTSKDRRKVIVNYVTNTLRTHNVYVFKFVFCEFLNFINIIGQMYLMDTFLGGMFTTYGSDVITMSNQEFDKRLDPMAKVFPKVTKCTFHKYGPSGTIQNHDGLCVLAINIITEKIYLVLWFWFVILAIWTGIYLCFRLAMLASRSFRHVILCGRARSSNKDDVAAIMDKMWFGDWFILMQLAKNMNPQVFHDLVIDLRDRMDPKRSDNLEMVNGNAYPTLPLLDKKPKAPYMETA